MNVNLSLLKMAISLLLLMALTLSANAQCDSYQALLDKMDKAQAEKNVDLLAEVYHADAKRHTAEGTLEGLAAIQEQAKNFYTNVPDAVGTNEEILCSGDKVAVRWTGTGTPKDANKKVQVTGITIYHIKDGKVIEEWEEMSTLSLMMQLGYELKAPGGN